jgi:hypothetical protein
MLLMLCWRRKRYGDCWLALLRRQRWLLVEKALAGCLLLHGCNCPMMKSYQDTYWFRLPSPRASAVIPLPPCWGYTSPTYLASNRTTLRRVVTKKSSAGRCALS